MTTGPGGARARPNARPLRPAGPAPGTTSPRGHAVGDQPETRQGIGGELAEVPDEAEQRRGERQPVHAGRVFRRPRPTAQHQRQQHRVQRGAGGEAHQVEDVGRVGSGHTVILVIGWPQCSVRRVPGAVVGRAAIGVFPCDVAGSVAVRVRARQPVVRSVRGGRSSPSTCAVQVSPAAIGCDSVSVPELTRSPACNGPRGPPAPRAIADASSPRHSAGLRSTFFRLLQPRPSPFLSRRTVKVGKRLGQGARLASDHAKRVPTTSAAWRPRDATKSAGWNCQSGNTQSMISKPSAIHSTASSTAPASRAGRRASPSCRRRSPARSSAPPAARATARRALSSARAARCRRTCAPRPASRA